MTSICQSVVLDGLRAERVAVEVDVSRGQPTFTLVGLGDLAVQEARERVWSSLRNSPYRFPLTRKTVNLAPAASKKVGTHYDLPIAVGLLVASGQCRPVPPQTVLLGELGLDGRLRTPRGILPLVRGALELGATSVVLPEASAHAVSLLRPSAQLFVAPDLVTVVTWLNGGHQLARLQRNARVRPAWTGPDLADVRGQDLARRALEIAAVGRHAMLMRGPPGSGKSLLASCLVGILPPLCEREALTCAELSSLAGMQDGAQTSTPPFRDPHHASSLAGILGGGPQLAPGDVSLAHNGVLFLDELPLFHRDVLDGLREPLETGVVRVRRARGGVSYPAQSLVVAAMNICPCGPRPLGCTCTAGERGRYAARLSGPLVDRFDLRASVERIDASSMLANTPRESSGSVRERVIAATSFRLERGQHIPNGRLPVSNLPRACRVSPEAATLLERAGERLRLSGRALHRTIRVARSIADLAGREHVETSDIAEALQHRGDQSS